jgi:hypothetical protein
MAALLSPLTNSLPLPETTNTQGSDALAPQVRTFTSSYNISHTNHYPSA